MQKVLLGGALVLALAWNLAQAAEVKSVQVSRGAAGTRAEIALDVAPADYRLIRLSSPDRLVVDLPSSSVRPGAALSAPAGIVRGVRYGQPAAGTARVVFDLAQSVAELSPQLEPAGNGARLVIEWPGDPEPASVVAAAAAPTLPIQMPTAGATTPAVSVASALPGQIPSVPAANASVSTITAATTPAVALPQATRTQVNPRVYLPAPVSIPAPASASSTTIASATPVTTMARPTPAPVVSNSIRTAPPASQQAVAVGPVRSLPAPVKSLRDANGRPLRALVIAIDAGHGGQDPGALGPSGRREKDITLAIARELARQVNATPGYRAQLTRDSDFFLPLSERTRIAKRAGADMFVSIHADAAENRAARGSSVYVLSLKGASSQRARWLADKENAADLIGGVRVEPGNTLASVLLDLTQSGNLKASEDVGGQVLAGLARLGPNHKSTVERANFAVLRTSDIPAMLVETAFISNPEEERRLSDPTQQAAIARAVFSGISGYFVRTPPPGTLLAARTSGDEVTAGSGRVTGGR